LSFSVTSMISNSKLQLFISLMLLLAVFKIFFFSGESYLLTFLNDALVIVVISVLCLYIMDKIREKKPAPLSLIMNIGILNAFAFFVITFSENLMSGLFENINQQQLDPGIISTIVSLVYVTVFFVFFAYVLMTFRELFFFKQTKNVNLYFQTMLLFIFLSTISAALFRGDEYSFIRNTFFIVSIILIAINSIRISWIAFINKKEKLSLLAL
jgi:hypothetical protein